MSLVILAAAGLRVTRLAAQPLWWDEGYSVWFATHPLQQMAELTALDIHPPLYYALLRAWIVLLGAGPIALRLFSVVAGTLSIPVIYLAGRRLLGPRAAWLGALLMAINPLGIYYSQEVRMYGLEALLAAGVLAASWPILSADARPRWRPLIAYVLLTVAALYTEYYAVLLPIGLTLYALWRWRRQPAQLGCWLAAQAAAALLYLPWVLYATPRLVPYIGEKVVADADRPLGLFAYLGRHLAAFLAGHLEGVLAPWWPAALIILVPLGAGVYLGLRRRNLSPLTPLSPRARQALSRGGGGEHAGPPSPLPMLLVVVASALALGYAISLRFPFFPPRGERLLLAALPAVVLLWAAASDELWRKARWAGMVSMGLAATVAGASLLAFYTVPRYPDDDYRPLIARIIEQGRPEDTVFCVYPWQVGYWRSYAPESGYTSQAHTGPQAILSPSPGWNQDVALSLSDALRQGHVWFPEHLSKGALLETRAEAYLRDQHASQFTNQWYGTGTRLSAWSTPVDASTLVNIRQDPIRFALRAPGAAELVLAGVQTQSGPVEAANVVTPLILDWQAAAHPPALTASIRLVDDLGQIWAQHDYELQTGQQAAMGWEVTDELGLLVPAGTPPGHYKVQVAVSRKDESQTLDALNAVGGRRDAAPVFELVVAPAGGVVEADRLPIARRQETPLEDGLRFLGFSAGSSPLVPGAVHKISLFWQATASPAHDYTAFVQLLDGSGNVLRGWEAPPGAAYPTTQWAAGTLMRTQASLRLPAGLADGRYRLIGGLFRSDDRQRLRTAGGADQLALGTVTVRGRGHDFTQPKPERQAAAVFGGYARLVGYDLPATSTAAGGSLPVTFYWQAVTTPERAYTVFVHLVDAHTPALGGAGDGEPGAGRFPTSGWVAGEYVLDRHTLAVDPGIPSGRYRIAVGLYDPDTGQRLALPDGSDQLLLDTPVDIR